MILNQNGQAIDDEGFGVPDDDMAPFDIVLDGVTFDPRKPQREAARRRAPRNTPVTRC